MKPKRITENERLALIGDRLNMGQQFSLRADPDGGSFNVYVEQESAGKDSCNLQFCNGESLYSLCFLTADNLEQISEYLLDAARQLRYCTKEQTP